tara:strand:+ start:4889 stop:5410 length:522 start_codon:yes stop_codon:yes gene_type:complete
MATNYLISVENLKKKGLIHQNTDTKILGTAIIRVQDMVLQPVLGSPLFRALKDRVEGTTAWTSDYRTLMNDYVVPAMVASVDYKAALLQKEKITNKTTGHVSDENITTATKAEIISFRSELQSDADFYLQRLIGFLKDDCGTLYPEYTEAITRTNHDIKKESNGMSVFKTWMT